MIWYFAYGTNLNPEILRKKKIAYRSRQRAALEGFGLRFNKRSRRESLPKNIGFANIVASANERVEGALYGIDDELDATLDRVEKCPDHYRRLELTVETDAGPQACFGYQARPELTAPDLIPSQNYVNHILAASDLLSAAYRQQLERMETYAGECAVCHKVRTVLFRKVEGRMFVLCPACIEARGAWGAARGRPFSVLDAEVVMQDLLRSGRGYGSIQELVADAVRRKLIEP